MNINYYLNETGFSIHLFHFYGQALKSNLHKLEGKEISL